LQRAAAPPTAPGAPPRCCSAHQRLELLELSAPAAGAAERRLVETRRPPVAPARCVAAHTHQPGLWSGGFDTEAGAEGGAQRRRLPPPPMTPAAVVPGFPRAGRRLPRGPLSPRPQATNRARADRSTCCRLFPGVISHRPRPAPQASPPSATRSATTPSPRLHRLNIAHDHGRSFGHGEVVRGAASAMWRSRFRGPCSSRECLFLRRPPAGVRCACVEMTALVKASSKNKPDGAGRAGGAAWRSSDLLATTCAAEVHRCARATGTGGSGQLQASTAPS